MMGTVFGIGEVLWDLLPSGPQLGGAPANFAFHVAGLGIPAGVVTRVGQDAYGDAIRTRFSEMRLPGELIQADSTLPTGTVSVTLSPAGVPDYTIHEPAAWDRLAATPEALSAMETAAAVCFGSLAQRRSEARQAIQRLVTATPPAAWRIFDVNLRQCYYDRAVVKASLELANVLKLNEDEVPLVTDLIGVTGDLERRVEQLAARFQLRVVVVTRGDAGSLLLSGHRWSRKPAWAVDVQDSVGAGDAFTAALCVGLLRGIDLDTINEIANQVAAVVCTSRGATPSLPDTFKARLA
jgi:fructokinase